MLVKMTTKHQVTIPKSITDAFHLEKGNFLEITKAGNMIVMIPKEAVFEDKYPQEDLIAAEKALTEGSHQEEVSFKSADDMIKYLRKRIKK